MKKLVKHHRTRRHAKDSKKKSRVPSLRLHKASGRACVVLSGKAIYCGQHGTPEAEQCYYQAIAEWLAAGKQLPGCPGHITVKEVISRFWTHAEQYYQTLTDGRVKELEQFRLAFRPLKELYANTSAIEFGPRALKAVRRRMIDTGWCRPYINKQVNHIQNAENFLDDLAATKGAGAPPVIIMNDHVAESMDLTEDMMRLAMSLGRKGVTDLIKKPFPTAGRTLDRVIKKVLAGKASPRHRPSNQRATKKDDTRPDVPPAGRPVAVRAPRPAQGRSSQRHNTAEASTPIAGSSDDESRSWASVPNEPVTLDSFMTKYCEPRTRQNRICRKKALLAADL